MSSECRPPRCSPAPFENCSATPTAVSRCPSPTPADSPGTTPRCVIGRRGRYQGAAQPHSHRTPYPRGRGRAAELEYAEVLLSPTADLYTCVPAVRGLLPHDHDIPLVQRLPVHHHNAVRANQTINFTNQRVFVA